MMDNADLSLFQVAKRWSTLALVAGTLLIILSGVGFWVQWAMISEDGFVDLTGNVLTRQDTRDVLSAAVIDRLLDDYPILRALVRDPLEAIVSAILGSALFATAIDFAATRIWETLFVNGGQVSINLEPLQTFLYGVISGIAPNLAESLSPDQMPSELVLLNAGDLPNMERVSNLIAWTTWITLFAGLGLTGFIVSRAWSQPLVRYGVFVWTGIFLIVEAVVVAILTIPTRSTVILAIDNSTGRTIAGTTYDLLIQRLLGILLMLALAGAVLGAVGLWKRYALRRSGVASSEPLIEPVSPEPQAQPIGAE